MPKVHKPSKLRNFVFTLNNYTDADIEDLHTYKCSYITYCKEVGGSGTPHLQGYIELDKQARFTSVCKAFKWHIEARKGTQAQAIAYCHKSGAEIYQRGKKKGQGKRTDIHEMMVDAKAGMRELDLWEKHETPMVRYYKSVLRYKYVLSREERDFKQLDVIVLLGPPGVGKSRKARELDPLLYEVPSNDCKWFDGYDGQETILLDDFEGECPYRYLLKLLDGYHFDIPVKGGFVWKNWKRVIITCNQHPKSWYPKSEAAPLLRRITEIFDLYEDESSKVQEMDIGVGDSITPNF